MGGSKWRYRATKLLRMIKRLKVKIIYWLAQHLLPVVDDQQIISFKNKKLYINHVEATVGQVNNLVAEANLIEATELWKIINNDLNEKTRKRVYVDSTDVMDLVVGKTILYTLDVQQNLINKIKNL